MKIRNIEISDLEICSKILEKEYSIPKSIFFTYFNLHIPQLELSDIYKGINRNTSITELKNLKLQYSNVENIIQLVKKRVEILLSNYNSFYGNIIDYKDSKLKFKNGKNLIIKDEKVIDEVVFGKVDSSKGDFIQNHLHYIGAKREDTLYHFGFTNSNGEIIAYNSVSILDRNYPLIAFPNNVSNDMIINMTRAFGVNNAPANLMGGLYYKTMMFLKNETDFEYIMTYINQNLGFSGASFLGASYIPIAYSPMNYTYVNGLYKNRKSLKENEDGNTNKLNMLPIILLARGLNKENQNILESRNGFINISKNSYYNG
ncbi:hypothetical protein BLD25_03300 [Candidatus Gracilibacteria bacterium GN02-872]|nr:hypothetical protein BLD25_03300 [Candidatus Gracilibacteria bacterium GN02-872]